MPDTSERVIIFLADGHWLEGNLHVPRHSRLLDILNHQADIRPFLALTDVAWTQGAEITRHEFVCVHRDHIRAVRPAA